VGLLQKLLVPAIDSVGTDRDKFRRFLEYFEALLAYHKANGGADKARGQ
jgi:CRISPR type III-A-associated protein Csm2